MQIAVKDNAGIPDYFNGTIEEIFMQMATGFTPVPDFDRLTIVLVETSQLVGDSFSFSRGGLIAIKSDTAILMHKNGVLELIRNITSVSTIAKND